MAVNVCEERILKLQKEYPFLLEIGYSLKKAGEYLSNLNIQIRKEKNKNKQVEMNGNKEKRKQEKKQTAKRTRKRKTSHVPKEIEVVDQDLIEELKVKKQILVNYIRYLKRYHQIQNQNKIEAEENQNELTSKQQTLFLQALSNDFSDFRLCDFYTIYCYALDKQEYQEVLVNIVQELQKLYVEARSETKEEIATYFGRLRQQTTYHLLKIDEKNRFLKELSKTLQNYRKFHTISTLTVEQSYDPLEDFLKLLLESDSSYPYLEKLLYQPHSYRDVVNFKDSQGYHILFTIQELLLTSCMLELIDQTKDYIPKEYYKRIWQLFITHPNLSLEEEERQQLHQNEEDFIEAIQLHHYKKGPIIQQFILNLSKIEEKEKIPCPETFSPCYYGDYHDLIEEYTFSLSSKGQPLDKAYSVRMTEQGTFLVKVHIVDVSATILEDSPLDAYLKDKMFKTEEFIPNNICNSYIYLQQDPKVEQPFLKEVLHEKKRPVMTYEMEVDDKGQILNFAVYQSMIVVNQVIDYEDVNLKEFKKDDNLYPTCYLYYAFSDQKENMGKNLEDILLSMVKKMVKDYFAKKNVPMIYHVQGERNETLYAQYMRDSSYLFGRMNLEEARLLHNILKEDTNYAYLGLENIGHFALQDSFCIPLFHPCNSYIDLMVQRLMKYYFFNKNQILDTEDIEKMIKEVISLANERLASIRTENRVKKFGK